MSKRAFTPEFKIEVLNAWEKGNYSLAEIVKMYKVFESTIREWKYQFDKYGTEGLKESSTFFSFTPYQNKQNAGFPRKTVLSSRS